jgi:predicted O-methyltransferase YrrM
MNKLLKKLALQFSPVQRLLKFRTDWAPGHYYSPIPDKKEAIELTGKQLSQIQDIQGIELNDPQQLALFEKLVGFMRESSFRNDEKLTTHRFFNKNGIYAGSDTLILEAMIRQLQPTRIIEVGSGYTSMLMLDINEKYFNHSIKLTFIEPYPERLFSLLSQADKERVTLYIQGLQTMDLSVFKSLKANDILFIDSSHVAKTGSDLLYLYFEIFPVLAEGVYIHFHDIFNNFEYQPFHYESFNGFGWNECYFIRSFLMYNRAFQVVLFSNYLDHKYKEQILSWMPDYPLLKGAQFWIKKTNPATIS